MRGGLRAAEKGASAIEYSLLAALIAMAAWAALASVGTASKDTLTKVSDTWCAKHASGPGKGPARCR